MRNLFDNEFEEEDYEYYDMRERTSKDFFSALMEDQMNREKGNVIPDTTGADKFFIDGFLNGLLNYDFWVIARDFMCHHFADMPEFNEFARYMNGSAYQTDPEKALQIRIFSIIYNAAKSGDEYSLQLINNLYKTYHKREYKQLKQFKKITVSEIFSLAESKDGSVEYEPMARILGMCPFLGIELEDKCSILYIMLNRFREDYDAEIETEFFEFPDGLYQKSLEQIDFWMTEEKERNLEPYEYSLYWKVDSFVSRCFERFAYPEDFLYRCDTEFYDKRSMLAQTLALLKSIYPREEFSYEDIQKYAHIYKAISALVSTCDSYEENLNELFGISTDRHILDGRECLYKPATSTSSLVVKKEEKRVPTKSIPAINVNAVEEDYIQEIEELRQRLHKKEAENHSLKMQYNQTKRELKETQELIDKYQNDRDELIALRNHMYHLSEEDVQAVEENMDDMKDAIAKRNIVIVGGHTNWVNKLKKEFPNWKFFDANISRINEAMILDDTEKLYFFTNHLSHGTYGIYISIVREKKIPFGYLHSVNLDAMIRQIYYDMK